MILEVLSPVRIEALKTTPEEGREKPNDFKGLARSREFSIRPRSDRPRPRSEIFNDSGHLGDPPRFFATAALGGGVYQLAEHGKKFKKKFKKLLKKLKELDHGR